MNGNPTSRTVPRCGATLDLGHVKLRCWFTARHDKTVWHQAHDGQSSARWNDTGSYEISVPTRREEAA